MKTIIILLMLALAGCSEHPTGEVRTEGYREGPGWAEVERRAVGDAVYVKYANGNEVRWFETRNLRTRAMGKDEEVPR